MHLYLFVVYSILNTAYLMRVLYKSHSTVRIQVKFRTGCQD